MNTRKTMNNNNFKIGNSTINANSKTYFIADINIHCIPLS